MTLLKNGRLSDSMNHLSSFMSFLTKDKQFVWKKNIYLQIEDHLFINKHE